MLAQPALVVVVVTVLAHLPDGRCLPVLAYAAATSTEPEAYEVGACLGEDGQWSLEEVPVDAVELELVGGEL